MHKVTWGDVCDPPGARTLPPAVGKSDPQGRQVIRQYAERYPMVRHRFGVALAFGLGVSALSLAAGCTPSQLLGMNPQTLVDAANSAASKSAGIESALTKLASSSPTIDQAKLATDIAAAIKQSGVTTAATASTSTGNTTAASSTDPVTHKVKLSATDVVYIDGATVKPAWSFTDADPVTWDTLVVFWDINGRAGSSSVENILPGIPVYGPQIVLGAGKDYEIKTAYVLTKGGQKTTKSGAASPKFTLAGTGSVEVPATNPTLAPGTTPSLTEGTLQTKLSVLSNGTIVEIKDLLSSALLGPDRKALTPAKQAEVAGLIKTKKAKLGFRGTHTAWAAPLGRDQFEYTEATEVGTGSIPAGSWFGELAVFDSANSANVLAVLDPYQVAGNRANLVYYSQLGIWVFEVRQGKHVPAAL